MQRNILIISNCRLGDALVMIPALRSLKALGANITLASEAAAQGMVAAKEILDGKGLVDCFVSMSTAGNFISRGMERLRFFAEMRKKKWDLGIVLMPPCPPLTMRFVRRLRLYLRLCGCRQIIAPTCITSFEDGNNGSHVSDLMLNLLRDNGIATTADAMLPPLAHCEEVQPLPPGGKYLAVAPGANMPVKCWDLDNYAAVLDVLATKHGYSPIYISGENERALCERLNEKLPGMTVIGRPLPEVECIMRQCSAYLGNDTGLIHLAAALGLPCIGIYSNRDAHCLWEPYTTKKLIFYPKTCACSGCLKTQCDKMCIKDISPEQVINAIESNNFLQ